MLNKEQLPKTLLVGSITHSIAQYQDGPRERYGGGVMYGGKAAAQLEIPTTVITIGAEDIEPGMSELRSLGLTTYRIPRNTSNNFSNDYRGETRKLYMRSFLDKPMTKDGLPKNTLQSNCVIFYPIYNELSTEVISAFNNKQLLCLDPQGFTRQLGEKNEEKLYPLHQTNMDKLGELKGKIDVLKLSDEDIQHIKFPENTVTEEEKVLHLAKNGFPLVILTKAAEATIVAGEKLNLTKVPTFPVTVKDTAGAGDTFGVGFMLEYYLTKDPVKSAAFANACSSLRVSGEQINYSTAQERAREILNQI